VPSELVAVTIAAMVQGAEPPAEAKPRAANRDPPRDEASMTCPECGGVLSERSEAGVTQWACYVGHRYSPDSLADAQGEGVEGALWTAIRTLEDRSMLLGRMAQRAESRSQPRSARRFRHLSRAASDQADLVRRALAEAADTTLRRVSEGETDESTEEGAA
jgi:two-component system chemotaxis response regulator CheB